MPPHDTRLPREDTDLHFCGFHHLMPYRVLNVLLVSSLYESFILEEEGLLTEMITSEYLVMGLSHAPRVLRASTADEALEILREQPIDLVITMTRLGVWSVPLFVEAVKAGHPKLPVVVLAGEMRELTLQPELGTSKNVHRVFVWNGDARILLAIIKFVEDSLNAEHDTKVGDVRVILLVENSVRFYSAYLPLIYGEVVKLTQELMSQGLNLMHRLLRMRARPKILLAETFEEGWELYSKYSENLLGVISDIRFPRGGNMDSRAGLDLVRLIRQDSPYLPVLLQSSDAGYALAAEDLHASFLHKESRSLLQDLRNFLLGNLGFGEFIFIRPNGEPVGRAADLRTFESLVRSIPDDSLLFHARNNHFSNWLMARTEFELAARIRPRKVTDFETVDQLRDYLSAMLSESREQRQAGIIADFSSRSVDIQRAFTRIGGGSIGGKARGLAFINAMIRRHNLAHRFPAVHVSVPSTAAIGTDVFDEFLDINGLHEFVAAEPSDDEIARAFLDATLPDSILDDLTTFLQQVECPLAVRSSSLLEDSLDRPFAGIYATYMIPNNHEWLDVRRDQLFDAIKLVYASTFLKPARAYLESTGRHMEEEKMGVILQELVGARHEDRFYPTFSGVARSHNFYPRGSMTPEDGVANVALGLGKTVVEGEQSLMFCPAMPSVLPQFGTVDDLLRHSQREFYALDISQPDIYPDQNSEENLRKLDLETAEADGALAPVGSVYSAENNRVYDGIFRQGPRLVTFAHVLKSGVFPLAEILKLLLKIGEEGMACPVEIEFAVEMGISPAHFGFLQIRPIISDQEWSEVRLEDHDVSEAVCFSKGALGNGRMTDVADIIYVKPDCFEAAQTREIAAELGELNEKLRAQGRRYVLIGPGRWGSSDRWLGIPVTWDQISHAQVLIETTLNNFLIEPSQGSHFFQNITSLGLGYFSIDHSTASGRIDWDWLGAQPTANETQFVRHVRFNDTLDIRLDGRSRQGVIFKPGYIAKAIPADGDTPAGAAQ